MQKDNINYLAVGSFVLAMLLLLLFSLYKITGKGTATDKYYVSYTEVAGIHNGSTVTYGGFEIGKVMDVTPERVKNETRYRLTLGVRKGWPIPSDSTAQIVAPSVLAEKQIDIREGNSNKLLSAGATIKGLPSADIMAIISRLSGEFEELSAGNIQPLITKLNNYLGGIGDDLNQNIPKITQSTNTLLTTLNDSALRLNEILRPENQQRLDTLFVNANEMSESLITLTQHLNATGIQVKHLLKNSNKLVDDNSGDIRQAVTDLRTTLDVLSQNINMIVHNMATTSRNMNEFTHELRRNPSALINSKPATDAAKE
ncbi:MAG: MlaD family protein [Gammaproteobacteria bacterium]|nr:MlaD family protein [Gammaproteobacteria bacterium]